jgi:hypothetical protein
MRVQYFFGENMHLSHVATFELPPALHIKRKEIFDRLCLHKTGLAEMVINEMRLAQDTSICSMDVLKVETECEIPDLQSFLKNGRRVPLNFWQLLSLAMIENFKSFYCVSAIGSARSKEDRNGEALISVPSLMISETLSETRESESRLPTTDPKRDFMIENIRRSRSVGCQFRNKYNTQNMWIAVVS